LPSYWALGYPFDFWLFVIYFTNILRVRASQVISKNKPETGEKMVVKIKLLVFLFAFIAVLVSCRHSENMNGRIAGELKKITVAEGYWQGKNGFDLNNGELAVTILPGEGGRIIEITDCNTGKEFIQAPNDKTAFKHGQHERTLDLNKLPWSLIPLKDNPLGVELTAMSKEGVKAVKKVILDDDYPIVDFYWEYSNPSNKSVDIKINSLFQFNKINGEAMPEVPSEAGFEFTRDQKPDEIMGGYQHEDGKFWFREGHKADVTKRTLIYVSNKHHYAFVFVPVDAKDVYQNFTYDKLNYYHLVILGKPVKLRPGSALKYHYRFIYISDIDALEDIPEKKLGINRKKGKSVVEAIKKQFTAKPTTRLEFDAQQLKILKKGAEAWNKWRKSNPKEPVRLSGVNLKKELKTLSGYDMHNANLAKCNLYYYGMSNANFDGTNFTKAFFGGTNYGNSSFKNAIFYLSNPYKGLFRGADVSGANFTLASCYRLRFYKTKMVNTCFKGANLSKCDIKDSVLKNTNFSYANLTDAKMIGNKYESIIFTGANVENATLDVSLKPVLERGKNIYGLKTVKWVEGK